MPVKRRVQKITQHFRKEDIFIDNTLHKSAHKGIDLRSVNFTNWKLQKIIATEDMTVLRMGRDGYGNGFVVCEPVGNPMCDMVKYIHVKADKSIHRGKELKKGDRIGRTEIAGNSKAHHLHFETMSSGWHFNPINYFNYLDIKYRG